MMSSKLKQYFSKRLLGPIHDNPKLFVASEWQHNKEEPHIGYLIYRLCIFTTFFTSWTVCLVNQSQNKWIIYLTNWGYTLCTAQALLGFVMVLMAYLGKKIGKTKLQEAAMLIYPAYWIVITIATSVAFGITIIYWTLIHNAEKSPVDALNVLVHGTNSLLMMAELWIVAFSFRIIHLIYPVSLAFLYAIFSVIYYSAGGTSRDGFNYIYPILRWDKPGTAVLVCLGVMVFIIFLHILSCFMCYLRTKLYQFMMARRKKDDSINECKSYVNEAMANETV